jgi:high-affinity iron transporter
MLATLLIVFREVVEAGLIVGIVLAATVCVPSRGLWVSLGVIGGVIGAALVAVFAGGIAALFQGSGQELFNAAILILAVVMLTWHNVWMANHGKEMSRELKAIGAQVKTGGRSLLALAVVVGVAVLREGSEVTLFLYGVAAGGGASAVGMMTGGLLGVLAGAGVSLLMYLGLLAIPAHRLFAATTGLITLLAAGLAAQAAAFLQKAGAISVLQTPLWDTSGVLPEGSTLGRVLKTIVGYNDQPDGLQLIAWLGVIAVMLALMRVMNGSKKTPPQTHPAPAAHAAE